MEGEIDVARLDEQDEGLTRTSREHGQRGVGHLGEGRLSIQVGRRVGFGGAGFGLAVRGSGTGSYRPSAVRKGR